MGRHLLLTGAAGLVGQYLLRDLLQRGVPVAVLMRGRKGQSPEARVEQIVGRFEAELERPLPRPVCLQGDIAQPRLGLTHEDWNWAAQHCGRVMHNAASVSFHGSDRSLDPWLSNLTGTANVLELCRQIQIHEFHYMSTAYVCGKLLGPVLEDAPAGTAPFRNDYEQSKFEAEQLVRSASFLERPTIYRPATIVGDSRTGRTTSYHGLYPYLQFVALMRQASPQEADGSWRADIRFNLTGDERRNLVTVDWVSAVSVHLLLGQEHHGRTYHLTPPWPITTGELDEAFRHSFKYYGQAFVGPDGLAGTELNELEKLFYGHLMHYQAYWSEEPAFDCRNTLAAAGHLPCPRVDKHMVARLIDYAERDQWGKRRRSSA